MTQRLTIRRRISTPTAGTQILATGTVLLLILGLLVGLLSTSVLQQYVKAQLSDRLSGIVTTRSDAFASIVEAAVDKAVLVNASGGILRNMAILDETPDSIESQQQLQHDAETLMHHGYRSVRILKPNGSSLVTEGQPVASPDQSIRLVAPINAQLMWKHGFILKTWEKVYNPESRLIGVIELERELPNLTAIYLKKQSIGSTYDSFTCGTQADGLVGCFPALLTQEMIRLQPLTRRARLPVDDALQAQSGLRSAIDYRGQPVMAAYGPIGTFGLATVAKIDEADLYAPAKDLIEDVLLAVAGLLLVGTIMLNARIRPLVNRITDAELQAKAATVMAVEREVKIQAVVEHAHDGILTMGSDGMVRTINPAGANLFGYKPSDVIGRHFTILLPERYRVVGETVFSNYKQLKPDAAAKKQTNLMTGLHQSGKELYFELGTNQIQAHGEELFIGILHDVTDSRRVQQALEDSEQRLRTITDNLPVLIAYVTKDLKYEFANVTYEKWFCKPRQDIVGRSVKELFSAPVYARIEPHIHQALRGEIVHYEATSLGPGAPNYGEITYLPDVDIAGKVKGYYVLGIDTTAQKNIEEELEKQHELLTTVLETIDVGVVACDAHGSLSLFNRATKEFHGLPQQDLPPEDWSSYYRLYQEDAITPMASEEVPLIKALRGESVDNLEMAIQSSAGRTRQISASGGQLTNSKGELLGAVVVLNDITERKLKEEQLRSLARHDILTGLPNRNFFNERIADAISRSERTRRHVALMFLDIDRFKSVNDTYGHHAGDLLLKAFAARLLESVRRIDTVARLAGDEFVIILEGLRDANEASMVGEKILQSMEKAVDIGMAQLTISTSIGIALQVPGEADAAALLRRADKALYAAKAAGRGCCHFNTALADSNH